MPSFNFVVHMRSFTVYHYGRKVGVIRAASAVNAFANAKKKYPHLPSAELDLQDPLVIVRGDRAFQKAA